MKKWQTKNCEVKSLRAQETKLSIKYKRTRIHRSQKHALLEEKSILEKLYEKKMKELRDFEDNICIYEGALARLPQ